MSVNFAGRFDFFKEQNLSKISMFMDQDHNLWFSIKDLCSVLNYANVTDASKLISEENIQAINLKNTPGAEYTGGNPKRNIVNMAGMNELILSSNSKDALDIKKWLATDVVPNIYAHGGYVVGQEELEPAEQKQVNSVLEEQYRRVEGLLEKRTSQWHNACHERDYLKEQRKLLLAKNAKLVGYLRESDEYNSKLADEVKDLTEENQDLELRLSRVKGGLPEYEPKAPSVTYFTDQFGMVYTNNYKLSEREDDYENDERDDR